MAYDPKRLLVWAYHSTHTLWRYDTDDYMPHVCSAGYFDAAADMLRHGDIINVVTYAHVNKMPASRWLCVGTPVVTGHPHVITEPVQ